MPTGRVKAAAAAIDGKLYVVGGRGWFSVRRTLERYDPSRDSGGAPSVPSGPSLIDLEPSGPDFTPPPEPPPPPEPRRR